MALKASTHYQGGYCEICPYFLVSVVEFSLYVLEPEEPLKKTEAVYERADGVAGSEILVGENARTDYHQEDQMRDALQHRFLIRGTYFAVLGPDQSLDEILLFLVLHGAVLVHLVEDFPLRFIGLKDLKRSSLIPF